MGELDFSLSRETAVSRQLMLKQSIEPCWFCTPICRMLTSSPNPSVEETEDQRGEVAYPKLRRKVTTELESELRLRLLSHCDTAL